MKIRNLYKIITPYNVFIGYIFCIFALGIIVMIMGMAHSYLEYNNKEQVAEKFCPGVYIKSGFERFCNGNDFICDDKHCNYIIRNNEVYIKNE